MASVTGLPDFQGTVSYGARPSRGLSVHGADATDPVDQHVSLNQKFRPRILLMAVVVSMGGFVFGFDTGQISGFLQMPDYKERFADISTTLPNGDVIYKFSNLRAGLIVGILSIGTMLGALISPIGADKFGRRLSIIFWSIWFIGGICIQITTQNAWYQIVIGRIFGGLGVGALSVITPMYQAETAPKYVRGALISCYQLFITFGIFLAYCINYGTSGLNDSASWRITMGMGFIWPAGMAFGILFLPESPRWDYRNNNVDRARRTIAKSYGVELDDFVVTSEMHEIQAKLDAENAGGGDHYWYEIFTGPRMAYRTFLGLALQALQQLTGANFFFYYGTSVFAGVGIPNSFVTSIILGTINFVATIGGLYIVERFGRRVTLITGGLWMSMCFLIFASIGVFRLNRNDPQSTAGAGYVMITFTCLFIVGFATTWGPIVWALVGELYPTRYRAKCMGLATASNWIWNFLISFFTPYITGAIGYKYGYIFAAGNCLAAAVVYFFVCESAGRSLEEIDEMYLQRVNPITSKHWKPDTGYDDDKSNDSERAYGNRDSIAKDMNVNEREALSRNTSIAVGEAGAASNLLPVETSDGYLQGPFGGNQRTGSASGRAASRGASPDERRCSTAVLSGRRGSLFDNAATVAGTL